MSGTVGNGIWTVRPLDVGVNVPLIGDGVSGTPTSLNDRFDGDAILVVGLLDGVAVTLSPTATNNFASGGAGDDFLFGNGGNDILAGGIGADLIDGGTGIDSASYRASETAVSVNLRFGTGSGGEAQGDVLVDIERVLGGRFNDRLTGGADADTLDGGSGNDVIVGSSGANLLIGGGGNDTVLGGADNDRLVGGSGNDILAGGAGIDRLTGGDGADILTGGAGIDLLFGEDGADRFRWTEVNDSTLSTRDRVMDFSSAEGDKLDFGVFDASYEGAGRFAGGGEASIIWRASAENNRTTVFLDADGDASADVAVLVFGVTSLAQSDFLL